MKIFLLGITFICIPLQVFSNTFYSINIGEEKLEYISYEIGSLDYKLKVGISPDAVDLDKLSQENNAISGINGVFFCPMDYSQCSGKNYTINERFVEGEDLSYYEDTGARGVFGWDSLGRPFIHQTGAINSNKRGEIYEGLGNYPILFINGQNTLEDYIDNGLYDSKMQANLPRHFICSNKEKTHIYIGRSSAISLEKLTSLIYSIGCWDALNLDAGKSAHFMYSGYHEVVGSRKILDGFLIERKGINTKEIHQSIERVIQKLEIHYKNISYQKASSQLKYAQKYLSHKSVKIYNTYSQNILDSDGAKIGYKTRITSIEDEKNFYTLNSLETEIGKLIKELKN